MDAQFQHFVQKAYLRQWSVLGRFHAFDKKTRKRRKNAAPSNSCGEFNWQSPALEAAYNDVEGAFGKLKSSSAFTEEEASHLKTWVALHYIRNPRNVAHLRNGYTNEVSSVASWIGMCGGFTQIFAEPCLITSDTPVCVINCGDEFGTLDMLIMPLSPSKALYVTPNDRIPKDPDSKSPCFKPSTLNLIVEQHAMKELVSFDDSLHLP